MELQPAYDSKTVQRIRSHSYYRLSDQCVSAISTMIWVQKLPIVENFTTQWQL